MKKTLVVLGAALLLLLLMIPVAVAGPPEDPGCFGQDRSGGVHYYQASDVAPGASEWGASAAERGGTNGDMNRAWKTSCGGDPS